MLPLTDAQRDRIGATTQILAVEHKTGPEWHPRGVMSSFKAFQMPERKVESLPPLILAIDDPAFTCKLSLNRVPESSKL
jgi:hypothetical protein